MGKRKYTDEQFINAVRTAKSFRQVLHRLGLKEAGGNYAALKRRINELDLDISHMTGQAWNREIVHRPKVSIGDYLSNRRSIQSYKLKLRLIRAGIFEPKCSNCSLTSWRGHPIPLELEHKTVILKIILWIT